MKKKSRDRTRLNKAWEPVRAACNEACPPAQREFVRKLARDLNAEIKFAGETAKAPPPSLQLSFLPLGLAFAAAASGCLTFWSLRRESEAFYFLVLTRMPGSSPLMNSTPPCSSARCIASNVTLFDFDRPFSNRVTVVALTLARFANSRIPHPSAPRA